MRHPKPLLHRWAILVSLAMLFVWASLATGQSSEPTLSAWGTASGAEAYRPGKWSVVRSTVTNPSDQRADVLVAHFFAEQPLIQFATRLTLPPRSRRNVEQLIRIPDTVTGDSVTLQTLLLDPASSPERVFENSRQTGTLILSRDGPVTAMLCDEEDDEAIDFAGLIRRSADFKPANRLLRIDALPSDAVGYEAIDGLFISAARPRLDPAQLAALRTWLIGGGRVWIMLDQVEHSFLDALLREDSLIQEIARVPLTKVSFDEYPQRGHDFAPPVTMTRVLPGGAQAFHHIQKWPASLRLTIGQGSVIVTTLSPKAWRDGRYKALKPLQELAEMFFAPSIRPPLTRGDFEPLARQQMAYSIVGRGGIVAGMAALMLVILVPGGWLTLRRQGEWTALLAAVASIVLSLVFVVLGSVNRKQSPPAVNWSTLAYITPSQREATVQGLASIYTPEEGIGPVQSNRGGVAWPVMETMDGSLLRLTWSEGNQWQWQNLRLPSGAVRLFHVQGTTPIHDDATVALTFDETGVLGAMLGTWGQSWENTSLLTPSGLFPVRVRADGRFTVANSPAPTEMENAPNRATLMSDLLAGRYAQPLLVGWAPPVDMGLSVPQGLAVRGGAIIAVPVQLIRPAQDTRCRIPSSMIGVRPSDSPDGIPAMPVMNPVSGEWRGPFTVGGPVTLRAMLPSVLMPMKLERLSVHVDIHSPGREIRLQTYQGSTATTVTTWNSPQGIVSATIEGDALPTVDVDGTFYLTFLVEQTPDDGIDDKPWMIRGMNLEAWGVILPPDQPAR